ncbi:mitochondrial inner membrane protease subunit 2 isoform X1 [Bufo gargarizans]|uniref:mitochondrial inner membrane protease subunit 2 isoform X1 n=1 Tax=Bufo gargarizans TaxID=30331 RepID=UPI001CF10043|nr:mitochondrial inner membrane protease subunit 2 isoform X1 [Bufo gargarizans]XP_044136269.1 mitochondrial inner membrane protease subunit 2 isoform X1 [Bufo gargarizans]
MEATENRLSSTTAQYEYSDASIYFVKNLDTVDSVFKPTLYCFIFSCGLVGNALVLWILICFKKMDSLTDIYLLNMAISDLMFVFSLPFVVYQLLNHWVFGEVMCKMLSAMYFMGFFSSIFFITVLSVDRYLAIVHVVLSLKFRTMKLGLIVTFVVWTFSFLLSATNFIFHKTETNNGFTDCAAFYPEGQEKLWTLLSYFQINIFGLIIPLVILVSCYSQIIRNLHNSRSMQKKHAVKLILILVFVFFVFWSPYNIVIFLRILNTFGAFGDSSYDDKLKTAMEVSQTISFLHCCLNPIIYTFAGDNFKKHLFRMFNKLLKCMHISRRCRSSENTSVDRSSFTGRDSRSYSSDAII